MAVIQRLLLFAAALLAVSPLYSQATEASIVARLKTLRSLSAEQRPIVTVEVANDIRALPPGINKVRLADSVSHLVTEGDQGQAALQTVADALRVALAEAPISSKSDQPPMPYMDLATLVRYEHVTAELNDPLFAKAQQILADNDAGIEKADFTLRDLRGKKYTLSQLRGQIVVVNFWATWCPPCRLEMPSLDAIYTHFQPQGLVVLSITDEDSFKVASMVGGWNYHPPILIDTGDRVEKEFHITGIPKTFVFDRDGKLVGEAIDQCSMRQFLQMLSKTDLHP